MAPSRKHFALETQQCSLCVFVVVVELHVTVKYIEILNVAQQCCYGEFISPARMKIIRISF